LKAFAAEDGTPLRRGDIAIGKAHGALAMGVNEHKRMFGAAGVTGDTSHKRRGGHVRRPGGCEYDLTPHHE
jgi:hypothetical protein